MIDEEFYEDAEERENQKHQADSEADVEAEESRADAKVKKAKDELAEARAEAKANLDGWQRAKADYVNLLKRSQEDVRAATESGKAEAIEKLLPAYDAIERAKEHGELPPGFAAIVKQLEAGFASLGLTPLGEVGEDFSPALHDALGQDEVKEREADGTVTAVLEKGWKQGERVLRPAKVRVGHYGA